MTEDKKPSFWLSFAAGGVSGTIGAVITCPLEVIKTRFQSSSSHMNASISPITSQAMLSSASKSIHSGSFKGTGALATLTGHVTDTAKAMQSIYRQEGLAALWRGVGATVVGVMPSRALYFASYNTGKPSLANSSLKHCMLLLSWLCS